jgi:hypothetical protein
MVLYDGNDSEDVNFFQDVHINLFLPKYLKHDLNLLVSFIDYDHGSFPLLSALHGIVSCQCLRNCRLSQLICFAEISQA